jgi:hypothetical protein
LDGQDTGNDRILYRRTERNQYGGKQHHNQGGPLKQCGSEVLERMIRFENIKKDLVKNSEGEKNIDAGGDPVGIEVGLLFPEQINWELDAEHEDLGNHVREKRGEFFVQLAPVENDTNGGLRDRLGYPKHQER